MGGQGATTEVVERINNRYLEVLPDAIERLTWPLEHVHQVRDERLRELLTHARERSPWHRGRLRGVDIDSVTGDDLAAIPTMTKSDLMASWDSISCNPSLTLAAAQACLDRVATSGLIEFIAGDVLVVATGGSTGRRGVIALDPDGVVEWSVGNIRHGRWLRDQGQIPPPPGPVSVQGRLTAVNPTHVSGAVAQIFQGTAFEPHTFPPTMPVADAVAGLNELQPDQLFGYASMLHRMAHEAKAGRLTIAPRAVGQAGEALLPEIRASVGDAFGVPVGNIYGASESFIAQSNGVDPWLHLSEDLAVFEVVDDDNHPVEPGQRGTKLLVTNVVNKVMPLIRYEITDELTLLSGPNPGPWTGRRIADPEGRRDDWFDYGGAFVHPQAFRSPLSQVPISEYQVQQTPRGAEVAIVVAGPVDLDELCASIASNLASAGLDQPDLRIRSVDAIERHSATAKLRRFIPL
ncbi:MAG: hypothetical protein ABWZ52_10325 [Acidimicrobiales bacterium]